MEYRPRKRRRPNFTDPELIAMVSAVSKHQDILSGKFHSDVGTNTNTMKATAWRDVTDAVNTVSHVHRYTAEVRNKYKYFKCDTKRKKAFEKKLLRGGLLTSGIDFTPAEVALLNMLEQSAVVRSDVSFPNDGMSVEEKTHSLVSPKSEEPMDLPCSTAPEEGSAAEEPGPSMSDVDTATSPTPPSPTTNHLLFTHGISRTSRILRQHQRRCQGLRRQNSISMAENSNSMAENSNLNSIAEVVEVQRQIKDLLQDLNNTVATGFRDLAAAIKYAADKSSQAGAKDPVD